MYNRGVRIVFGLFIFFVFYTFFWLWFFKAFPFTSKKPQSISVALKTIPQPITQPQKDSKVLSAQTVQTENNELPKSYKIDILPRRQSFNLSCEFAAAASIIYHFTVNPAFSPQNENEAEKTLMAKVGVSQNPNIGIRMGDISFDDFASLFTNLNKLFGGTEYYGVHAPPFIDLFPEYNLYAKPILKSSDMVSAMQKAISQGRLIMTWIKIGYGKPVDIALSYGGSVPLVRGEHTVVINGYDENGFFIMDPGSGRERNVPYQNLINSMQEFPMPLLEIYPSSKSTSFEVVPKPVDSTTGLRRGNLRILVKNASGKTGVGNEVASLFREFGYKIVGVESQEADELDVSIKIKREMRDYLYLLRHDLSLLSYRIATVSSDLNREGTDAVLTIGR